MLGDLGADCVEVQVPDALALIDGWSITCGVECTRAHAATYPARKDEYGSSLAALLELGLQAGDDEYHRLERERSAFRLGLGEVLANVDALIAPCMVCRVPAAERTPAAQFDRPARFVRFTAPFDFGKPHAYHAAGCRQRRDAAHLPAHWPTSGRGASARHRQRIREGSRILLCDVALAAKTLRFDQSNAHAGRILVDLGHYGTVDWAAMSVPMVPNMKTHGELRSELVGKATEDEHFRAHLIANPKAAIQDALGVRLPGSLSVTVHEDSATTMHLVLPPPARLMDEDLEQIAAGHNVQYLNAYQNWAHKHDANGQHIGGGSG